MIIEIIEIDKMDKKSFICEEILRTLPNWFGVESAIIDYANKVRNMPFYVAMVNEDAVGFIAILNHNEFTSEICVMGIKPEFHRLGIGRKLVEKCESYCKSGEKEFLTVKTLDKSRFSKSYEKTRLFYEAVGFKPLEVFSLLWDENNPCLLLAKHIKSR